MLFTLLQRDRLELSVQNDRNPQFVTLSDGSIRNGFTIKILNMEQRPRSFSLTLSGLPNAALAMVGVDETPASGLEISVDADELRAVKVYVTLDQHSVSGELMPFAFNVLEKAANGTPEARSASAIFHAPKKESPP